MSETSSSSTESLPKLCTSDPDLPAQYHILTKNQKWNLVVFISLAGCFSPLTSIIYFLALGTIATDLSVGTTLVSFACLDAWGRRLTVAICLTICTAANLALAYTSGFPMLMVLRGLQAAGSAVTISIGAGVIGDIANPQERGGFMGTNAGVRMMGQAVGPVIGGPLNSRWGYRSIFWLLFVLAIIVLTVLLIFLPEAHRGIAGNGSIPLSGIHKPLVYSIKPPHAWSKTESTEKNASPTPSPPSKISLGSLGSTMTSTTPLFLDAFPFLTPWQAGLKIILLTYWKEPNDARAWTSVGLASRMTFDLGWHKPSPQAGHKENLTDLQRREFRHIEQTLLVLLVYGRSLSLQTGKPWMIERNELIGSAEDWW
ncbi:major facilitator superfamily domain-containing protein [Aspergillus undulatus]|uniref:major facilitator superfamily domain-containing protein n=1 Tax=Aspergillus undulatus TaxID=1810928 RepID=UPI003CCE32D9